MIHCNDNNPCGGSRQPACHPDGRFIGRFDSLLQVLKRFPEGGGRGWFFLNEETLSLWMWDPLSNAWHDTICVDSTLRGVIDDPETFSPEVRPGQRTSYLYVQAAPGTVTFARFLNRGVPVSAAAGSTALILLFWNGDLWECTVTPFYVDLAPYALADLSNVSEDSVTGKIEALEASQTAFATASAEELSLYGKALSLRVDASGRAYVRTGGTERELAAADLSNVTRQADPLHDGLLPAADKVKLNALFPLTLDVDAARLHPTAASRTAPLPFLGGYSLSDLLAACRSNPSGCLFGYRTGRGETLRTGSLEFAASGDETRPLSITLLGHRLAVHLGESVAGGEVQVRVWARPADISVALYGGPVASYAVRRAGYPPVWSTPLPLSESE